jgi:glycosyltransferase involved in cell wall biosynthesis
MKKTICLNMIVRDERHVIERCLESVKKIIDYWVIVDTGSRDGTQNVIKEFLKDVPGQLHERRWVNFGYNRNEALSLARDKSDYILFIDADDRLVFSEDFVLPELNADGYWMIQKEKSQSGAFFKEHNLFCLMKSEADIRWHGVIHESLTTTTPKDVRQLQGVFNEYINDGARSKDPDKIRKEILVLQEGIKEEPLNIRYQIHLARAYWFLEDYDSSLKHFEKAAEMQGPVEDLYYSLTYIALCQKQLNYPSEILINSFSDAYLFHPTRAESLYRLASYYMEKKNFLHAFLVAKRAIEIPPTTDTLFVESWIYDWGALILFFECAKAIGSSEEAFAALEKLFATPSLPAEIRQQYRLDEWHREFLKSSSVA